MNFTCPDRSVEFQIPDDWWSFSEMHTFRPNGGGFYPYSTHSNATVEVVPLSSVEPPTRKEGVPTLRKYKLVPVLLAFQSPECALPPVEVERMEAPGKYPYRVRNGYHRFYASVAVGYNKLPVVVVGPGAL